MTALTDATAQTYSDLYKDVHGVRPRWILSEGLLTEEEAQEEIQKLCVEFDDVIDQEIREHLQAQKRLENEIAENQREYGVSRATSFRWILDAHNTLKELEDGYGLMAMESFMWEMGVCNSLKVMYHDLYKEGA